MIRILREGRAQSADEALEVLKTDLKALNADVQVLAGGIRRGRRDQVDVPAERLSVSVY